MKKEKREGKKEETEIQAGVNALAWISEERIGLYFTFSNSLRLPSKET